MASIDYYLKKRKNKEKHPIYLRVTHRRETNLVLINIKVWVKHWNKNGQEVRISHPRHDEINKFLTRYRIEIESEVFYWEKKNPLLRSSDIKQRILRYNKTGGSDSVPEIDFFEFVEDLIDGFKRTEKYRREKNYRAIIKQVKDFWKRKKLHLYEVDVTFLRNFELFLQEEYENNSKPLLLTISEPFEVEFRWANKPIQVQF